MQVCGGCQVRVLDMSEKLGVTEEAMIVFLQNHGVFLREKICPTCGSIGPVINMRFRCQRSYIVDGIRRKCTFRESIKTNTWLSKANMPLVKIVHFVSLWLQVERPRQEFIKTELEMSQTTVVDWSESCREVLVNSLILNNEVLGGPGMTVEIDEAEFGRTKNYQGSVIDCSWVFGCIERETKRSFIVRVRDRSATTMIDMISCRIAPGTTIVSDRWRVGDDPLINNPQYHDLTVNHGVNFVDPQPGAYNQNIVGDVRTTFFRKENMKDGHLAEFYWKLRYERKSRLHEFFLEVARQFDPAVNR